jgi:hypothetical protein
MRLASAAKRCNNDSTSSPSLFIIFFIFFLPAPVMLAKSVAQGTNVCASAFDDARR